MLAEVRFYDKSCKSCKSEKIYTYRIPLGLKLKKGDLCLVIVEPSNYSSYGYQLVEVQKTLHEDKYNGTINLYELKWIQSKVDFSYLDKTFEKINRRKELAKKIDVLYEKASKMQILKIMAKDNPDFKKLIDEFEQLDGEL